VDAATGGFPLMPACLWAWRVTLWFPSPATNCTRPVQLTA